VIIFVRRECVAPIVCWLTLRALGRLDEALAAYDRTVKEFPQNAVARNGQAVVLSDLGRHGEARAVLKNAGLASRTQDDWVAVHILCMIDFYSGRNERSGPPLGAFCC
jgi:tetratricopeptide (TPR) repeat protein